MVKYKKFKKFIPYAIIIPLYFLLSPWLSRFSSETLISRSPRSLLSAALLLWGFYILKSIITVIPLMVLYAISGIIFPKGWSLVITYFGVFSEISLGYIIGRYFGGSKTNLADTGEDAGKFRRLIQKQGDPAACFMARLLPVPVDFVNFYFGKKEVSFPIYVFFSLLGLSPMLVATVIAGENYRRPLSPEFIIPFAVCLSIGGIIFLLIHFLQRPRH